MPLASMLRALADFGRLQRRNALKPRGGRRAVPRAALRGCTSSDNPFESDSREARAWTRGLLEGRTKRLTLVHSPRFRG